MTKMSKKGKFLLGAGIGVGLGLLFAPKSGDETRKELKDKCARLAQKIKQIDKEEVKDNISQKLTELQNELKDLDKEKVMSIAKEKAEIIKNKADELVKLAIEKGSPAVEEAAKEVRKATAGFLKNMSEKIDVKEPKKNHNNHNNKRNTKEA